MCCVCVCVRACTCVSVLRVVAHNNKLSTIDRNVNVWSKERDSSQCLCLLCVCVVCVCVCVCVRLCLSGGRSRWLFVPSHVPGSGLRIEAQSETHPCPVRGSPRILLMEELCMSGKACRILLRSSLAHTMKAFMGLLMWPEEGGGRASA